MSKLLRRIETGQGISLEKLDLSTGIVAFDNSNIFDSYIGIHNELDRKLVFPFIVAWPVLATELKKGHQHNKWNQLRLIHYLRTAMSEEYTLHCTDDMVLQLMNPEFIGKGDAKIWYPDIKRVAPNSIHNYVIGTAYSGKEEIAKALEEMKVENMDFYAPWFK